MLIMLVKLLNVLEEGGKRRSVQRPQLELFPCILGHQRMFSLVEILPEHDARS